MTYKFKIPMLPQSVNSLYKVNYRTRQIYLSEEGRRFKNTAKMFIPKIKFSSEKPVIDIRIKYFGNWYCKNGNVRRVDGPNLDKVLFDAIFERLGLDDSLVFFWQGRKECGEEEYTEVEISEVLEPKEFVS